MLVVAAAAQVGVPYISGVCNNFTTGFAVFTPIPAHTPMPLQLSLSVAMFQGHKLAQQFLNGLSGK